jgi:hypothetical protein
MYCVYMSQEYLAEESADELYGEFIDAEYNWRDSGPEERDSAGPSFLRDEGESDVDLLTGEGSDAQ